MHVYIPRLYEMLKETSTIFIECLGISLTTYRFVKNKNKIILYSDGFIKNHKLQEFNLNPNNVLVVTNSNYIFYILKTLQKYQQTHKEYINIKYKSQCDIGIYNYKILLLIYNLYKDKALLRKKFKHFTIDIDNIFGEEIFSIVIYSNKGYQLNLLFENDKPLQITGSKIFKNRRLLNWVFYTLIMEKL